MHYVVSIMRCSPTRRCRRPREGPRLSTDYVFVSSVKSSPGDAARAPLSNLLPSYRSTRSLDTRNKVLHIIIPIFPVWVNIPLVPKPCQGRIAALVIVSDNRLCYYSPIENGYRRAASTRTVASLRAWTPSRMTTAVDLSLTTGTYEYAGGGGDTTSQ